VPTAGAAVAEIDTHHVVPGGEGVARQRQKRPAEVELVGALAIFGIDPVEIVIVRVNTAAELEAKGLVARIHLESTLGLDDQIGAIGRHRTSLHLCGNGQSQCCYRLQGKRITLRHTYSSIKNHWMFKFGRGTARIRAMPGIASAGSDAAVMQIHDGHRHKVVSPWYTGFR